MPRVYNRRYSGVPDEAVPIERGTDWGNPFRVNTAGSRAKAIAQFREWVDSQPEYRQKIKNELRGKDLVCCCKPKPCHGDVLLEIANKEKTDA